MRARKLYDDGWLGFLVLAALVLLVGGAVAVGLAHMEAGAYERVTGRHVSTFDALWIELRVDCD